MYVDRLAIEAIEAALSFQQKAYDPEKTGTSSDDYELGRRDGLFLALKLIREYEGDVDGNSVGM